MRYIVTGCDGQLGGRVAENMIKEVAGTDLILPVLIYHDFHVKKKKDGRNWVSVSGRPIMITKKK